jgi:hypothetical protein
MSQYSQAGWYLPVIPALRGLRQEEWELQASRGYIVRPCLKIKKIRHPSTGHFVLLIKESMNEY